MLSRIVREYGRMGYSKIRYEATGGIATITLDDPSTRNALGAELVSELIHAVEAAGSDDAVRCVVLGSSHETVFSAGGNLAELAADEPLALKHFATELPRLLRAVLEVPRPTICAASGHVLAGGLGVALACDLVLAGEKATFGTPEINVGLFPFMISALVFRNVPRKKANELLLLGERLTAEEALDIGLVNKVVPAGELDRTVRAWAEKLASKSPVLMRLGKAAMVRQQDMGLDDALEFLHHNLTLAYSTEDLKEGVSAFFEKREPSWKGR